MGWAIGALVILAALIVGWLRPPTQGQQQNPADIATAVSIGGDYPGDIDVDRRHKGSNRNPADIATAVEHRRRLPGRY